MKVKALKSFAGAVSMRKDEVRDIADEVIVKDLLRAGHVEPVKAVKKGKNESKRDNSQ